MRRRLKQAAVVLALVFVGAQLVRPERANPPTDPSRTIAAHLGSSSGLVTVLDRACSDVTDGRMPGPWTLLHPETRLSTHDIAIVCEAARQTDARAPGVSR